MSTFDHRSFQSKIDHLSFDRDKWPWLLSIGLTRGTINRLLNSDQAPSESTLRAIMRSENASLNWLTEDKGSPYMVNRVLDDQEGTDLLESFFEEPGWAGTLIDSNDYPGYAIVLTQPGQYSLNNRSVDYTIIEIIAGVMGPLTRACFDQHIVNQKHLELPSDEYLRLISGLMGNAELLGWKDRAGLLNNAVIMKSVDMDRVAEQTTIYESDSLENNERLLLKKYRNLDKDDQQRLMTIADTLKRN